MPHMAWADLFNNQVLVEILVMSIDPKNGDLYFIRADQLDDIDRKRLVKILHRRDAQKYALWDLLSQVTLPNGQNALEFFEQLVKVRSVSGQIFSPNKGMRGAAIMQQPTPVQQPLQESTQTAHVPQPQAPQQSNFNVAPQPEKKKAGRPKKNP
jgi:hypothetical protein